VHQTESCHSAGRSPVGLRGGLNPYRYAAASPTNYNDPTGEIIPLLAVAATIVIDTAPEWAPPVIEWLSAQAVRAFAAAAVSAALVNTDSKRYRTYYHYTCSLPSSFEGGLWPGSSATPLSGLHSTEASLGLGISPPPTLEYPVTIDPDVTPVVNGGDVGSSNRYPGGLPQVFFPEGTPPGSVGPPAPVPMP